MYDGNLPYSRVSELFVGPPARNLADLDNVLYNGNYDFHFMTEMAFSV